MDYLPPMPSASDLSKRLRFALDRVALARGGEELTFPEIQGFLADRGVKLSRSRWSYMLSGDHVRTRDRELLTCLSELLEVPADYFYSGVLPVPLAADVELVRAMRVAQVQNFAARALEDIAPEAYAAIAGVLGEIEQEKQREKG